MDGSNVTFWSIMKWVLIVLAAGFIGQFGKTLATHLMERVRAKRAAKRGGRPDVITTAPRAVTSSERTSGTETDVAAAVPDRDATGAPAPDKKTIKTLAKMRKKELKTLKK